MAKEKIFHFYLQFSFKLCPFTGNGAFRCINDVVVDLPCRKDAIKVFFRGITRGITKPRNSGTPKQQNSYFFQLFFSSTTKHTKLIVANTRSARKCKERNEPKGHGSILMLLSPRSSDQRGLSQTPSWNSGRDAPVSTSCLFSINLFGGLILFPMHFSSEIQ